MKQRKADITITIPKDSQMVKCKKHGISKWSVRYDMLFCPTCDRWIEHKCKMPGCEMCESRPKKPSMVSKA